jgi:hypothetical protein
MLFADRRCAGDVNLPDEAHAVFQLDMGTDYTIRADLHAVTDARIVSDARRCINRHVLTDPTDLLSRLSTLCIVRKTQRVHYYVGRFAVLRPHQRSSPFFSKLCGAGAGSSSVEKMVAQQAGQKAAISFELRTSYVVKQNVGGVPHDVRWLTVSVFERAAESAMGAGYWDAATKITHGRSSAP